MFKLSRSRSTGKLDPKNKENLIFYGENSLPDFQLLISTLESVSASSVKWSLPKNYVIREKIHLVGWIEAFLRVEKSDLDKRFSKDVGSYESWVLVDREHSEINILFRLKTIGLKGHTEYRLVIIKTGSDEFICVE